MKKKKDFKVKDIYIEDGVFDFFTQEEVDKFIMSSLNMEKNIDFKGDCAICSNIVGDNMFITFSDMLC